MTIKAQVIKEKKGNQNLKLCIMNDIIKKVKRKSLELEEILTNHKRHISTINIYL